MYVLNNALPDDILVKNCERVTPGSQFHPQHGILKKTYVYRFFLQRSDPMMQRYGHVLERKIDMHILGQALSLFAGTHDFRAFSKEPHDKNTVRTIEAIMLMPCQKLGGYKIVIEGKSFLRHMIRRIVGAAFEIASRPDRSCNELKRLLLIPKLPKNLPTAPAKGLCLESIAYTYEGV